MSTRLAEKVILITGVTSGMGRATAERIAALRAVATTTPLGRIARPGPTPALHPRQRLARDAVLIVDGTLVPTRNDKVADCRLRGEGVHHAMHSVARPAQPRSHGMTPPHAGSEVHR